MTAAATAVADLCSTIEARYRDHLESTIQPRSWASNNASGLGEACLRRIVYHRTEGHQAKPMAISGAGYMVAGKILEGPIFNLLTDLGFRFEKGGMPLARNDYQIGARIDRAIKWSAPDGSTHEFIAELKTTSPYVFDAVRTAHDLKYHDSKYVRKWYVQLQTYLFVADQHAGLLILWDKQGGRLRAVPVEADLETQEELSDKATSVNAHLATKTLPDFIKDPAECRQCPFFGRICAPPLDFGAGSEDIDDPELVAFAEVCEKTKEAKGEYDRAWKRLTAPREEGGLRGVGVDAPARLGPFQVSGRWQRQTSYEMPPEVKAKYMVSNPAGAFRLTIERIEPLAATATGETA